MMISSKMTKIVVFMQFTLLLLLGFMVGYQEAKNERIEELIGTVNYSVKYAKCTKDCYFIVDSADTGYFYKTPEEAYQAAKTSMKEDSILGYTTFPHSIEVKTHIYE